MIPLTSSQFLEAKDENDNVFYLKYLTEIDNQVEYLKISQDEISARSKFYEQAKSELPKKSPEEKINLRAYELLIEDRQKNIAKHLVVCEGYINIFVVGWKGKSLLPFPEKGKPSTAIRLFEKYNLYRLIQNNIVELTGLTIDEIKN